MIKDYNKTALAGLFNYNDPRINAWADNVYEKLRQTGELAVYIERDKLIRERFNGVDQSLQAPIMYKDLDFTFGYAYCGEKLVIVDDRQENFERVYQIEFEVKFNQVYFDIINMFDGFVKLSNSGVISVGELDFQPVSWVVGHLHYIKIIRDHNEVSVFVDGIQIDSTKLLNQDIDTEFKIIYQTTNTPTSPPVAADYNLDYNNDFLSLNL